MKDVVKQSNNKVFFSWAGDTSKKCAEYYKFLLEQKYETNNSIFISTENPIGKDFLSQIVKALNECKIGLFFITEESKNRPWLNFEAGAIYKANNRDTLIIPIYVDITRNELEHSPFPNFQDDGLGFDYDSMMDIGEKIAKTLEWNKKDGWSSKNQKARQDFGKFKKSMNISTDRNKNILNLLSKNTSISKLTDDDENATGCLAHMDENTFFKIRKTVVEQAEGELILSGPSLFEALGIGDSNNRSISRILKNRIVNKKITSIKIFITDIMIFEKEIKNEVQAVNKVMGTQTALLRDIFPKCEECKCSISVYFIPMLDIDHAVITDKYMLYRNTKQWSPSGNLKGEFCLYRKDLENGEYSAQLAFLKSLECCSTKIIPEIDANYTNKDTFIAHKVKGWRQLVHQREYKQVHLYKLHYSQWLHFVACGWVGYDPQGITFKGNNKIANSEDLFEPSNLLDDNTQKVLLKYIKETQAQLCSVVKKYDSSKIETNELSGAWIYPSLDLGLPNNVTRLAGGFATGMLVTWRCGTPIVPIDATVNVCSSSVFELPNNYSFEKSNDEFTSQIDELIKKAATSGKHFSFDSGNHFIMLAQSDTNKKYLVLHSSAKEFKDSYVGLYPPTGSQENWFSEKIRKSPSPTTPGRYLRYLKGEDAQHFIWLAHQLETVNEQLHKWFAEQIGGKNCKKPSLMSKSTYHHYYMPTDTSIAIGTFVEKPGTTVPIFSAPGQPICLFEVSKYDNWTIRLDGEEKCLIPHGWGQKIDSLKKIEVSKDKLILHTYNNGEISYNTLTDKHINSEYKKIREFSDCADFLKTSNFLKGEIKETLTPIFLYCSTKKGKLEQ